MMFIVATYGWLEGVSGRNARVHLAASLARDIQQSIQRWVKRQFDGLYNASPSGVDHTLSLAPLS